MHGLTLLLICTARLAKKVSPPEMGTMQGERTVRACEDSMAHPEPIDQGVSRAKARDGHAVHTLVQFIHRSCPPVHSGDGRWLRL